MSETMGVAMGSILTPWQQNLCFGDVIQGSRIVPYVARNWAGTTLVVRHELVRLLSRLGLRVVPFGPDYGETGTRAFSPEAVPPLPRFDDMELPALWADESVRLNSESRKLQVGLCWHGSGGGRSAVGLDDDWRCISASMFSSLLTVPSVQFTALHFADRATELPTLTNLTDLGVWDFAGTAGLMRQLDLVITIDTSVAHLAGTLGVPTWLMLVSPRHNGFDGARWACVPPLYSSVRQFRQSTPGDWSSVISDVETALPQFVASAGGPSERSKDAKDNGSK